MAQGTKNLTGALIIGTPIIVVVSIFALVLLFMTGGSASAACSGGVGTADPDNVPEEPVAGYSGEQLQNAALVMNAAVPLGLDRQAQVIAVMTAMGESSLRNIDFGDEVTNPDGTPTCSLGLFQQQWCIGSWGTKEQVMEPTYAATQFLTRLAAVDDWTSLEPSIAAHKVQRNADPFHYEKFFDAANQVVTALAGGGGCTGAGAVQFPLSEGYNMTSGFGPRSVSVPGAPSWHAAVDLQRWPNPCGDQIYSISAGTVTYKAGYQLTVKAPEGWSVSYLHMRMNQVSVDVGDTVTAGQPIALVGNEGPSSGCHLDFRINQIGSTDQAVFSLPDAVSLGSPSRYAGFVHPEEFYELFGMELCAPSSCERQ
ncbi:MULTISPECIES: M23 family metallopeptidase [unclassified Microbacterium]|uniref:M23 family metallopeptidase n=1 Tax=unclassified Microbacterium TaxID=2609290 RepID=UPI003C2F182D